MGRQNVLLQLRRFSSVSTSRLPSRSITFENPRLLSAPLNGSQYTRFCGRISSPSATGLKFLPEASSFTFFRFASWYTPSERTSDDHSDDVLEGGEFELDSPAPGIDAVGVLECSGESITETKWHSPVRAVISLLDGYHDFSNFPWWVIIATSTLALRLALLPVLVVQLKKLARVSALMANLPPPFPPPFSGKSYWKQFLLFRKARHAIGCPSPLWSFASFPVQVPCFILWMVSIRRMSLDHHPGFDAGEVLAAATVILAGAWGSHFVEGPIWDLLEPIRLEFSESQATPKGGALWFQNLTEFPHGTLGAVFPLLIAMLHFLNVQIPFKTSSIKSSPGIFGLLARYYKLYLDILTVPIFFIGFFVPQGSLVYWVTNSSLNLVQQLSLKHPYVRQKLGLLANSDSKDQKIVGVNRSEKKPLHPLSLKHPHILQKLGLQTGPVSSDGNIPVEDLPADDVLNLALQHLAKGNQDQAVPLLRLASEKNAELEDKTSLAMGLLLLSRGSHMQAAEYFEQAICKIKDEEVTNLVVAYYGAGFSQILQGRKSEGIELLKKIADLKEPDSPMDKFCYFQGLVILGSTLFNEGQKAEAVQYLRMAAAFDPAVNNYIEECERAD